MSDTIEPVPDRIDQQQLAQQLVDAARADGVELVGPGGLLTGLTKTVLWTALEAEMSEHLGPWSRSQLLTLDRPVAGWGC